MGRAVEALPTRRLEVAAGSTSESCRDHLDIATIYIHGEDLVAGALTRTGRLEDEPLPIAGEICLGILPTIGELSDIRETGLRRIDHELLHITRRCARTTGGEEG